MIKLLMGKMHLDSTIEKIPANGEDFFTIKLRLVLDATQTIGDSLAISHHEDIIAKVK